MAVWFCGDAQSLGRMELELGQSSYLELEAQWSRDAGVAKPPPVSIPRHSKQPNLHSSIIMMPNIAQTLIPNARMLNLC